MAQAARLNLRMQKELKLLLTDPPPGASFPSLSSSSSAPSLSSIDAQIEGPEGTVYANGFFKLKIQIPDRYPFQPPMVTFATPVYHPNIDNGGRICLDILNLPPKEHHLRKGAWQPSLNISTVLTSIGLLLSEPNPDDGLMHEASQEYKYNRQTFDLKARSMTEKYARIDASENASGGQGSQSLLNPLIKLDEAKGIDISAKEKRVDEYEASHKRLCGINRKLSLGCSESDHRSNEGNVVNQVSSKNLYEKQIELKGLKQESMLTVGDHNQTQGKKLVLEPSVFSYVKHDSEGIDLVSNQCSSTSKSQNLMASSKSWPLEQPGWHYQEKPNNDGEGKSKGNSIETKSEKKELQESLESNRTGDDDENVLSVAQQSDIQFQSCESHKNFLLPQTIRDDGREPHGKIADGDGNGPTSIKRKKLGLAGRKSSLCKLGSYQSQHKDIIENLAPNSSFPVAQVSKNLAPSSKLPAASESHHCYERGAEYYATYLSDNSSRTVQRQPLQNLASLSNSNNVNNKCQMQSMDLFKVNTLQHDSCYEEKQQPKEDCREKFDAEVTKHEGTSTSSDADSVIVLDSEDSDEEQVRVARSKLPLARRRLLGKSKS